MIETLVPAAGLIVIDPITKKVLKPEGEPKEIDSYWQRRIDDRDVSISTAEAQPVEQPAEVETLAEPKNKRTKRH